MTSLLSKEDHGRFNRRQAMAASITALTATMVSAGNSNAQETDTETDTQPDTTTASATELANEIEAENSLRFDSPRTERWKFGLVLETPVSCTDVLATFVVPMDWPEQKVTPASQTIDPAVTGWEIRSLQQGAKQVACQMARVHAGSTTEISFELDIERRRIMPPLSTDGFVIPQRLSSDVRVFMGNSPNIDTSNGRIKRAARELAAETFENDWKKVERIYDFVREQVQYVEGPIRNASDALRRGEGDCEDMTSLFVALCRNNRIPARMVWIPDHCYPEFYLEDGEGNGTWFPCQAAGTRQFGRMDEYRPILQKGDRFKVAERKTLVRYVSEFFKCDRKSKQNPRPTFVRSMIGV
jgi:transglutaminase-like putative cysteine protease